MTGSTPRYTDEEIANRRMVLGDLVRRGLINLRQEEDGCAALELIQPDHPEVIALFGVEPVIRRKRKAIVNALEAVIKSAGPDARLPLLEALQDWPEDFKAVDRLSSEMFFDLMAAMETACDQMEN